MMNDIKRVIYKIIIKKRNRNVLTQLSDTTYFISQRCDILYYYDGFGVNIANGKRFKIKSRIQYYCLSGWFIDERILKSK